MELANDYFCEVGEKNPKLSKKTKSATKKISNSGQYPYSKKDSHEAKK